MGRGPACLIPLVLVSLFQCLGLVFGLNALQVGRPEAGIDIRIPLNAFQCDRYLVYHKVAPNGQYLCTHALTEADRNGLAPRSSLSTLSLTPSDDIANYPPVQRNRLWQEPWDQLRRRCSPCRSALIS